MTRRFYLFFNIVFLISSLSIVKGQSSSPPLGVQVTPVSPAVEAPAIVTTKFSSSYPNVPAFWSKSGDNYSAEFLDPSTQKKMIVVYDQFGTVVSTSKIINNKKVPKPILRYLESNFPDTTLNVWWKQQKGRTPEYYSIYSKDTTKFTEQGTVIPKR